MFYLDNNSGVPVMPAVKAQFSNDPLFFIEGGNGIAPSWPGADWFNIVQSELLNILTSAGIHPDKLDHQQLKKALNSLFFSQENAFSELSGPSLLSALINLGISSSSSQYIPAGFLKDIGTESPDFNYKGTGTVTTSGRQITLTELMYNPARENVIYAPGTYLRDVVGAAYPTRQNPEFDGKCYRFVMSQGSHLGDESLNAAWVTAIGNTIGCDPENWQMVDAVGTNAMIYAGRVSRSTAIGSEVMAWFGARSQADLIKNCHDYWRKPSGNQYLPGEPGWNAADLETEFPGIGARLAAFTGYVTDPENAGYCTGVGRNALNHIVAGVRNAAGGYGAIQHLFSGSYNTGFGALALQSMVFGDGNTGVGDQSGRYANDCYNVVFIGYACARTVRGAQSSVFIGDRAADGVLSATRAVIIGPEAGRNHPTNLDNKLIIANQPYGGNLPLISGDFVPNNTGINIQPDNIRARLHVRYASSGSVLTPQFGALIEGSSTAGMTLETNNTGFCQLRFADTDSVSSGFVEYSHSSDSMTFGVSGVGRWRVESSGTLIPITDNTQSFGRAAYRPSVIYAGTGSINTSNEKYKVREDILEAEKAAALEIKADIWKFKFKDAIEQKSKEGKDARYHFGVGAQSVGEILRKHGLNPDDYAFYCYDKWEAEYEPIIGKRTVTSEVKVTKTDAITGFPIEVTELVEKEEEYDTGEKVCTLEAGENYGIRYEELLCFIMMAL